MNAVALWEGHGCVGALNSKDRKIFWKQKVQFWRPRGVSEDGKDNNARERNSLALFQLSASLSGFKPPNWRNFLAGSLPATWHRNSRPPPSFCSCICVASARDRATTFPAPFFSLAVPGLPLLSIESLFRPLLSSIPKEFTPLPHYGGVPLPELSSLQGQVRLLLSGSSSALLSLLLLLLSLLPPASSTSRLRSSSS